MRIEFAAQKRLWIALAGIVVIASAALTYNVTGSRHDDTAQGLTAPPESAQPQQSNSGHADPMEIVKALRQRLEINPNDAEALFMLGNSHMMIREFDKAENMYTRLLEINPKVLDARTNNALIQVQRKNYDAAIKLLKTNLELEPNNAASIYNLGAIYADYTNQREQALTLWDTWLKTNPDDKSIADEVNKRLSQLRGPAQR